MTHTRADATRDVLAFGALALWVGMLAAGSGRGADLGRHEYRKIVMGVGARVVVHAPTEAQAREAAEAAFARMEALEAALSDWRADAELARVNAAAGGEPVPVGEDLYRALELAARLSARTGRAFDPTVGRLASRARGPGEDRPGAFGLEHLELDAERRTVRLSSPRVALDLGGLGKGLACDAAFAVLERRGLPRSLVELGGDLYAGDAPPGSTGWDVAAGCADGGEEARLTVTRRGVATSAGTALPGADGELELVLDPRVEPPASPRRVREAGRCYTVLAPSGAEADALATAACVMGHREARATLAALPGIELRVHDSRARPLFDGESLAGWTTRGGRYDGDAAWAVEDGAIVGRVGPDGAGGLLYTEEVFAAFELELETRIDHPFDSGVFLRMTPRETGLLGPQVTLDHRPGGEIAGIYADGWWQHAEAGAASFREGGWNHVEVRCTGFDPRVDVWVNGEHVTRWALPADAAGFASSGRIGLQVHEAGDSAGRAARFRNVRLRELPVLPRQHEAGWTPLFDGSGLDAWEVAGPAEGWVVRDGVLEVAARGGSGHLLTREDFEDFRLRLDFRLSSMANSGVFLRAARDGSNPAYSGCEIQILDDFDWERVTGTALEAWQLTGSLYGAIPPGDRTALRPVGEWNTFEVLCRGPRMALALNGRVLWDVDTHALEAAPPFAERAPRGFIGLQRYGGSNVTDEVEVRFRDVYVERLPR